MYCTEFIFDGISSKAYDLLICSFNGGISGTGTAGSHIEFTTFKAPNSNKWVKTSSTYSEQLTFTFQVCKYKCGAATNEPLSERELAFLMRWLVRRDYKYLQFIQEGYEDIFYSCQINAEKYEIGGKCYGLTLTVICDAPWGWSKNMTATISSSSTKTVKLYDSSDEIGKVYPSVEIHVKGNNEKQDIQILNNTTGVTTQIKNCEPNEVITISEGVIKSQKYGEESHIALSDDFNWKWFSIENTFQSRENEITVIGNCDVIINWRVPRKAVI